MLCLCAENRLRSGRKAASITCSQALAIGSLRLAPRSAKTINCQMEVMLEHKKSEQLIEAFRNEDIHTWPDSIIHRGFYNRGTAYRRLAGHTQAAASDIEKSVQTSATTSAYSQLCKLHELGGLYEALKDDKQALGAYGRALCFREHSRNYPFVRSLMSALKILTRQGNYDEAFEALRRAGLEASNRFQYLQYSAEIYAAQGKRDEALARYREAVRLEGIPQRAIDQVKAKMRGISTD